MKTYYLAALLQKHTANGNSIKSLRKAYSMRWTITGLDGRQSQLQYANYRKRYFHTMPKTEA
jgi:hypothetical protein